MVVEHYGFMPDWPPNKLKKPKSVQGVYGPLARLSEEVGVDLLKDRSTVSSAFIAAVETMGSGETKKRLAQNGFRPGDCLRRQAVVAFLFA